MFDFTTNPREASEVIIRADELHDDYKQAGDQYKKARDSLASVIGIAKRTYLATPASEKSIWDIAPGRSQTAAIDALGYTMLKRTFELAEAESQLMVADAWRTNHFYDNQEAYWDLALAEDAARTAQKSLEQAGI